MFGSKLFGTTLFGHGGTAVPFVAARSCRSYTVPFENRFEEVASENRFEEVASENRFESITCEGS